MEMFKGVFPAVISPFTKTGELDTQALLKNIRRWNQYGLRGYLVIGSTAEAPLLEDKERNQIIRATRETLAEGMTLLAGAGRESTALTLKTCRAAAGAGADAVLVVSPWYYKNQMSGSVLEKHFLTVAEACPVPVLLYNIPVFTGFAIPVETVVKLAGHPNIVGMKDSSGNIGYLAKIIRQTSDEFALLCGSPAAITSALMLGATGGILAAANLVPEICVALYRAIQAANFIDARNLYHLLQPISEVVGGSNGIGSLKYAMNLLGYAAGFPRAPLSSPSEAQQQTIKQALRKANLLTSETG